MKSILSIFIACLLMNTVSAQTPGSLPCAGSVPTTTTNTGVIEIILVPSLLPAPPCNLSAGGDTVYMHAGCGYLNPDSLWDVVVGDWGVNDGKGMMTKIGTNPDTFAICFNIHDYFFNEADAAGIGYGGGPMPYTATPYNIGMVFRVPSCPIVAGKPACTDAQEGKDENCQNIQILGLQNPSTMFVEDYAGNEIPFPAVTATYITDDSSTNGIKNVNNGVTELRAFPVPFTDVFNLSFYLPLAVSPKAEIFDLLGQKVADFSTNVRQGQNLLLWRGNDLSGKQVVPGIYTYRLSNNNMSFTGKIIKQ